MIRVAATGDLHYGLASQPELIMQLSLVSEQADLLLIAGDLTQTGRVEEVKYLIEDLKMVTIPVVVVLGNHDYESGEQDQITTELQVAGVTVLEGTSIRLSIGKITVGVAGIKGFGHGFIGGGAHEFGEPEMRAFVQHARQQGERLSMCLKDLRADIRLVLLHYSPIRATLVGEPEVIHAFLGSSFLADAMEGQPIDGVFHGHAHQGSPSGKTEQGVPVWNVATTVTGQPFALFSFDSNKSDTKRSSQKKP